MSNEADCSTSSPHLVAAARPASRLPQPRVVIPQAERKAMVVLKFGSSTFRNDTLMSAAVSDIYRHVRDGRKVFAVVSALPGVTDRLIDSACRVYPEPHPEFLAALLATGEMASAAMLGLALDHAGIPATLLHPERAGLVVSGPPLEAHPVQLDTGSIRRLFGSFPVVVFPGFYGRTASGSIALLGRGGSDYTAVFAAHRLGANGCCLIKDVDGLYAADPKGERYMLPYERITWAKALSLGARAVQPQALEYALRHGVEFTVRAPLSRRGTQVGRGPTRIGPRSAPGAPLAVLLLGLGSVGVGVYRRLADQSERFELAGIAVRDPHKERPLNVPAGLLTSDAWSLLKERVDVVVELIGGLEPARSLIAAALETGSHVVTANKAVIARSGNELKKLADTRGVHLKYSASVCGSVPALEAVERIARRAEIESVAGVLNGTSNFILDRLARGLSFASALREAQERGFAEADPRLDLSGSDSADKLVILARAAFGAQLSPEDVRRRGIEHLDVQSVRAARERGRVIRLVAACRRTASGVKAEVRPVELPNRHPLAQAAGCENRLLLRARGGPPVVLRGKGAGCWPASLSVFADLVDLHDECSGRNAS